MSAPQSRHPVDDQGYITLDTFNPRKGDPGGFGFGGSNGVSGGFGVGGEGPQPGLEPHRRARYDERLTPASGQHERVAPPLRAAATGAEPGVHNDYPKWIDGFPHSFHGWGPNTPDDESKDGIAPPHGQGEAGKAERISKAESTQKIQPPLLFAIQDFDPFASTLIWTSKR